LLAEPLRARRTLIPDVIEEQRLLKISRGQELPSGSLDVDHVTLALDEALGAQAFSEKQDRDCSRALGLVLKCLDGPSAEFVPGRVSSSWQVVQRPTAKGVEADLKLLNVLDETQRRALPEPSELHFCVISARRTQTKEGVRDILITQSQFNGTGVTPRWYVDAPSLEAYRALGLDAVVGGKLIPARNMALDDAGALGKVCIQVSDDIAKWEFFHGHPDKCLSDMAAAAAWRRAEHYVVSPVAAARFLVAAMRGSAGTPKLAGVYPLGNVPRGFRSKMFADRNFILGDFFAAEVSPVRFDTTLTLKEDYDYTCSHLKEHGAVLRCNRLFISAKHETNSGGACSIRDPEGKEERKNIDILKAKWGRSIRNHHSRPNQVVLSWRDHAVVASTNA
jgi:hypothetical protein